MGQGFTHQANGSTWSIGESRISLHEISEFVCSSSRIHRSTSGGVATLVVTALEQISVMLVSPVQNGNYSPTNIRNISYPVQRHPSNFRSTASDLPSTPALNGSNSQQTSYRAPAHKHAHHLHSIPPREKSTHTLIVDHMLWVHGRDLSEFGCKYFVNLACITGRTRFAQARAELGMTDRTGGASSLKYIHRQRPENCEEEDQEGSEGEDVARLKARAGDPHHPPGNDEELRLQAQDLALARDLRLRAEGLEKVVTSMLEQPPPLPPINNEDIWTPPTSPRMHSFTFKDPSNPHSLPNGVRLRLALGTVINDLFARQAPPPPYRHQLQHAKSGTPSTQGSGHSPGQSTSGSLFYSSNTTLPSALAPLSIISATNSMASPAYSTGPSSANNFTGYSPQLVQLIPSFPLTFFN